MLLFTCSLLFIPDTAVHLIVPPIDEALKILPTTTITNDEQLFLMSKREEDLDVEDIYPENDLEIMDSREKQKQRKAESSSPGWK